MVAPHYAATSIPSTSTIGAVTTLAFAFFLAQSFARLGDVFPVLQPLRLGIMSQVVLLVALFQMRTHTHLLAATQHWTTRAVMGLAVLGVVTIPGGSWPRANLEHFVNVYVISVMVFVASAIAFTYPRTRKAVLATVIIIALVAAARPVLGESWGRYEIGLTYDSNVTAAFLVMLVPWAAAWAATELEGKWKWIPIIALPLFIMAVARTGSRGGILGLIVAIPFLLSIAPPRRRAQLVAVVGVMGLLFAVYARDQLSSTVTAITGEEDYNYTHIDGRIAVWKRGLEYIKESPILGQGLNGFRYRELEWKIANRGGGKDSAAHNMFLEAAVDLGLGGFLIFVGGCVAGVGGAWQVRKRSLQRFLATRDRADSDLAVVGGAAAASLLTVMVTGFFLSLAHQAPLYLAWGASVGVTLAERLRIIQLSGPMKFVAGSGPAGGSLGAAPGWRSRSSDTRWKLTRG